MNNLILGDSFEVMKTLETGSVGLLLTDPDFWENTEEVKKFSVEVDRLLHKEGSFLLWTPLCYLDMCRKNFCNLFLQSAHFLETQDRFRTRVDTNFVVLRFVKTTQNKGDFGEMISLNTLQKPTYQFLMAEDKCLGFFTLLIEKYHNPDIGYVLDPFSGGGSTMAGAEILGREYICIEKSKDKYEKSLKFMERMKGVPRVS